MNYEITGTKKTLTAVFLRLFNILIDFKPIKHIKQTSLSILIDQGESNLKN